MSTEPVQTPAAIPTFTIREEVYVRIQGPHIRKITHRHLVDGKYPPSFAPFMAEAMLQVAPGTRPIPYTFGIMAESLTEAFEKFDAIAKTEGDKMYEAYRSRAAKDAIMNGNPAALVGLR